MDRTAEATADDVPGVRPELFEGLLVAGTYRVTARLGGGGMGEVYQAEHLRLGSPVALKFLRAGPAADARSSDRFHHEARRAATVRSEHVVRVFDYGRLDDGTPYLVMERLFGEDLRGLLERERSLPIRRAVQLILGACRGLSTVHAAGLVHRDLKPANLFVEQGLDGVEVCKVLDFGVAKALESETTRPGSLVGTIRYMAPEQLEDASSATGAVDVYALGVILYECVTGVPAQQGATLEETMFNIVHRGVTKPSAHRPMPEELENVIMRAIARDPSERFPGMEAFARALTPFGPLPLATDARPGAGDETIDEARAPRPTRRGSQTGLVAVLTGVLGALAGWFVRGETTAPAPNAVAVAPRPVPAALPRSQKPVDDSREHSAPRSAPLTVPPPVEAISASTPPARPVPAAQRTASRTPARESSAPAPTATGIVKPAPLAARGAPIAGRFDPSDPYE